jgi:hypothetical protein
MQTAAGGVSGEVRICATGKLMHGYPVCEKQFSKLQRMLPDNGHLRGSNHASHSVLTHCGTDQQLDAAI